jgi:hypothetical protein
MTPVNFRGDYKTIFPNIENRKRILGREVDVYIPELNLGIECDGWYWHKDKEEKDKEKSKELESELFLLRVRENGLEKLSETDILLDKTEITLDAIKKILRFIIDNPLVKEKKFEREIKSYLKREDWAATNKFNKTQYERNGLVYEKSISFLYPEVASQWNYEKNYPLVPDQFPPTSKKKVWWKDFRGREWEALIRFRVKRVKDWTEKHQNQLDLF